MLCVKYKLLLWGLILVALEYKSLSPSQVLTAFYFCILVMGGFIVLICDLCPSLGTLILITFNAHYARKNTLTYIPIISVSSSDCVTHTQLLLWYRLLHSTVWSSVAVWPRIRMTLKSLFSCLYFSNGIEDMHNHAYKSCNVCHRK